MDSTGREDAGRGMAQDFPPNSALWSCCGPHTLQEDCRSAGKTASRVVANAVSGRFTAKMCLLSLSTRPLLRSAVSSRIPEPDDPPYGVLCTADLASGTDKTDLVLAYLQLV